MWYTCRGSNRPRGLRLVTSHSQGLFVIVNLLCSSMLVHFHARLYCVSVDFETSCVIDGILRHRTPLISSTAAVNIMALYVVDNVCLASNVSCCISVWNFMSRPARIPNGIKGHPNDRVGVSQLSRVVSSQFSKFVESSINHCNEVTRKKRRTKHTHRPICDRGFMSPIHWSESWLTNISRSTNNHLLIISTWQRFISMIQ